jgi:hypothetical protein
MSRLVLSPSLLANISHYYCLGTVARDGCSFNPEQSKDSK